MHEGLISRGKAMGSVHAPDIMSRYNCVLVDSVCHSKLQGVGGEEGFEIAARHLVKHEGYTGVLLWLEIMSDKMEAGKEALNRFKGIDFQLGESDAT